MAELVNTPRAVTIAMLLLKVSGGRIDEEVSSDHSASPRAYSSVSIALAQSAYKHDQLVATAYYTDESFIPWLHAFAHYSLHSATQTNKTMAKTMASPIAIETPNFF